MDGVKLIRKGTRGQNGKLGTPTIVEYKGVQYNIEIGDEVLKREAELDRKDTTAGLEKTFMLMSKEQLFHDYEKVDGNPASNDGVWRTKNQNPDTSYDYVKVINGQAYRIYMPKSIQAKWNRAISEGKGAVITSLFNAGVDSPIELYTPEELQAVHNNKYDHNVKVTQTPGDPTVRVEIDGHSGFIYEAGKKIKAREEEIKKKTAERFFKGDGLITGGFAWAFVGNLNLAPDGQQPQPGQYENLGGGVYRLKTVDITNGRVVYDYIKKFGDEYYRSLVPTKVINPKTGKADDSIQKQLEKLQSNYGSFSTDLTKVSSVDATVYVLDPAKINTSRLYSSSEDKPKLDESGKPEYDAYGNLKKNYIRHDTYTMPDGTSLSLTFEAGSYYDNADGNLEYGPENYSQYQATIKALINDLVAKKISLEKYLEAAQAAKDKLELTPDAKPKVNRVMVFWGRVDQQGKVMDDAAYAKSLEDNDLELIDIGKGKKIASHVIYNTAAAALWIPTGLTIVKDEKTGETKLVQMVNIVRGRDGKIAKIEVLKGQEKSRGMYLPEHDVLMPVVGVDAGPTEVLILDSNFNPKVADSYGLQADSDVEMIGPASFLRFTGKVNGQKVKYRLFNGADAYWAKYSLLFNGLWGNLGFKAGFIKGVGKIQVPLYNSNGMSYIPFGARGIQPQETLEHLMQFTNVIFDRNGKPLLLANGETSKDATIYAPTFQDRIEALKYIRNRPQGDFNPQGDLARILDNERAYEELKAQMAGKTQPLRFTGSDYNVGEIDINQFKKDYTGKYKQYKLINDVLAKNGIGINQDGSLKDATITPENLTAAFNELISMPDLQQLLKDNKGLPKVNVLLRFSKAGGFWGNKADFDTMVSNKQLLFNMAPAALKNTQLANLDPDKIPESLWQWYQMQGSIQHTSNPWKIFRGMQHSVQNVPGGWKAIINGEASWKRASYTITAMVLLTLLFIEVERAWKKARKTYAIAYKPTKNGNGQTNGSGEGGTEATEQPQANILASESLVIGAILAALSAIAGITLGHFGLSAGFKDILEFGLPIFLIARAGVGTLAEYLIRGNIGTSPGLMHTRPDGRIGFDLQTKKEIKEREKNAGYAAFGLLVFSSTVHELMHKLLLAAFGKQSKIWTNEWAAYIFESMAIGSAVALSVHFGNIWPVVALFSVSTYMILLSDHLSASPYKDDNLETLIKFYGHRDADDAKEIARKLLLIRENFGVKITFFIFLRTTFVFFV